MKSIKSIQAKFLMACIFISCMFWAYIGFIATPRNFAAMNAASEILNVFRVFPIALGLKMFIDLNKEFSKIVLLSK
jgi:hypothetical protein